LADKIGQEWNEYGLHKNKDDRRSDRAIVHCPDRANFEQCIVLMDAVLHTKRPYGSSAQTTQPAFAMAFAED
jgi:hypothetical protein